MSAQETAVWFVTKAVVQNGECLDWKFATSNGYPVANGGSKDFGGSRHVYRFVVEQLVVRRRLLRHEVVHHTCNNRRCLNLAHLAVVRPEENNAEMLERTSYEKRIAQLEAEVVRLNKIIEELRK